MIVVFGSLNMDLVMPVPRLPVAGETVLCPSYRAVPGGKGANQAVAAARLAPSVRMFGMVGADAFGDSVLAALSDAGGDVAGVGRATGPTACAAVMVDRAGGNQIVVASGANLAAEAAQVPDAVLGPDTVLLLQNEVRPAEGAALAVRAAMQGARVVLNLAPAGDYPAEALRCADVLLLNEVEAAMLAGGSGAGPEALARQLATRHRAACVVTLGEAGSLAVEGETLWRVAPLPVRAVDTTGAGDAYAGALAAALDAGLALPDALRRASVAGALACTVEGAVPSMPDSAAVAARLPDLPPPGRERPR
ncbi:MAG: ribokinase [Acetobacterales bacterium]